MWLCHWQCWLDNQLDFPMVRRTPTSSANNWEAERFWQGSNDRRGWCVYWGKYRSHQSFSLTARIFLSMNCISTHKTTGICFQKSTKDVFPAAKNITDATRSNVRLQAGIHIWCSSCLNNNDSPKKWGKQNSQAQSLKYTFLQWSLVKTTPPDKILDLKHSLLLTGCFLASCSV